MYKCGLYGGSFNPLHQGHVRCIIEAANMCKKLIIAISDGRNRNEIPIRIRYRWIYQLTKHIGNVKIMIISDDAKSKDEYDEQNWLSDAEIVKQFAGEPIDVVFCGSDYDENSFWRKCYPDAELKIFKRNEISSTKIRNDVYSHWDWLPNIVRPYYVKKVLIIGGESTGKSTLTINLANYYNTNYLEEVGREISERSGTDLMMIPEDFTEILLRHKMREIDAIKTSNRVLFEDTDCLTTLFYIDFLKGKQKQKNRNLAKAISQLNSYDLILFSEPDVPFVQDGDRSRVIASDREKYSSRIKELYTKNGFCFETIKGNYQERFKQSISLIDKLFEADKKNENNP
jgi:HTH-type transcriptional repressor of NAD biosynthesis genes